MTVRWGFVGAGYVAGRAMAPAVHGAHGALLQAVASREPKRSAELEPKTVHARYDDLIDDPAVDAVYVSLTNAQHKEWVIAALDAGKHVLCEKPLAMNAAEVREMQSAAERNGRLLVEAVWTRWQPRMQRMAEIVRRGHLGDVHSIDTVFTFRGDLTGNYRALPEFGGGALLDVGCYQAHLWMMLLGTGTSVTVTNLDRVVGETGIDLTTDARLLLDGRVRARALCSFDLEPEQSIAVTGTRASMRTGEGEAFTFWKQPGTLIVGDTVERFPPHDAFMSMVENVSAAINGEPAVMPPQEDSLHVAEILDLVAQKPA